MKQVSQMRVIIAILLVALNEFNTKGSPECSREKSATITRLQSANHWLGQVKRLLGASNPYPVVDDPAKIVKRVDTIDDLSRSQRKVMERKWLPDPNWSELEKINWYRERLEEIAVETEGMINGEHIANQFWLATAIQNVWTATRDAKMYLGEDLARLRAKAMKQQGTGPAVPSSPAAQPPTS